MTETRHIQTIVPQYLEGLRLSVSAGVLSPYFTDRDISLTIPELMAVNKAVAITYLSFSSDIAIDVQFYDGNTYVTEYNLEIPTSNYVDAATMKASAITLILNYASAQGYTSLTSASQIVWPLDFGSISSPTSSYQTIVSQTGTGAPAVGGSLTPVSTYGAGVTFTWARSSAGVYTLTASSAVFNTAGKTAVFVGPLNNLNGAVTAVVTSSTVITITTAVQSLAVLGLLGFTATPTDALMTKTMVYVQTYA